MATPYYKPVGVDENSHFPPRVQTMLTETFVTKPSSIADGQVPVWDATNNTWIAGSGGSGGGGTGGSEEWWGVPPSIDGGIWDDATDTWVNESGDTTVPSEISGGSPSSWR